MKPLSDLLGRRINAQDKKRKKRSEIELSQGELPEATMPLFAQYEMSVFNFFFENRTDLGIRSVVRFKNILVDGQLTLTDGRRLLVEVKYRMNWLKACQSEWEVRQFLKRYAKPDAGVFHGAIVVFERFSGDWDRQAARAKNKWGWEAWYLYHHDNIVGKPMELLMLWDGRFEGYPG
jgi:hypothetical protein